MKAGTVSQVYSDPAAFYIYKAVSERQVPLSEVKTQITQTLQREMFNDKLQEIQASVTPELNDAYFGPETAQQPITPGIIRPARPGPPGAGAPPPPAQNSNNPSNSSK